MGRTIKHHGIARVRRIGHWIVGIIASSLIGGVVSWGQHSPQPPEAPTQQSSQPPTHTVPPVQLNGDAALHHLNQVISWYRHSTTGIQTVGLPSDAIYQDNAQSL